jgi:hypothetical protein
LDVDDWNDVVDLTFSAAIWLYQNSRIERTPDTTGSPSTKLVEEKEEED